MLVLGISDFPQKINKRMKQSTSRSRPILRPVSSYDFPSVIQWLIVPVCCSEKATFSKILFWVTDSCHTMVVNRVLKFWFGHKYGGRCGGLMVSALNSRASGPGSSPGRGHCVVFLGKTLYSRSASLHPGV